MSDTIIDPPPDRPTGTKADPQTDIETDPVTDPEAAILAAQGTAVVTRFAPSPTGFLHIGGARTALFNWLFARANRGKFLLRIEDTDRARSTREATAAILDGLDWLRLDHDGDAVSQAEGAARHADVARALLSRGAAYKCFATQDEIEAFRTEARAAGRSTLYRSPWRDADPATHPDAPFVLRIKAPRDGVTVIRDEVQGDVVIGNDQLDDMVLLRSDGTPTYMLAVVVDDHDMGVTHVIRGDDHLNNAARQMLVYDGMDWDVPIWAHIPLIHGPDGKKLSKRHGALGVEEYRTMGYPVAGMRNYLTRLGWSHGDAEVFTTAEALEWFDLTGIGTSPARLDFKKLENTCGQHIAMTDDAALLHELEDFLAFAGTPPLDDRQRQGLQAAMHCLKDRAKTFPQLIDTAHFVLSERPLEMDAKAAAALDDAARNMLLDLTPHLQSVNWSSNALEDAVGKFATERGLKFGKVAQALRAALSGRATSPGIFDMMGVVGKDETLARMADVTG